MQASQRAATPSASAISSLVLVSSTPGAVAARPSSPNAFITPGVLVRRLAMFCDTVRVRSR